jgi:hypothetical protein
VPRRPLNRDLTAATAIRRLVAVPTEYQVENALPHGRVVVLCHPKPELDDVLQQVSLPSLVQADARSQAVSEDVDPSVESGRC